MKSNQRSFLKFGFCERMNSASSLTSPLRHVRGFSRRELRIAVASAMMYFFVMVKSISNITGKVEKKIQLEQSFFFILRKVFREKYLTKFQIHGIVIPMPEEEISVR